MVIPSIPVRLARPTPALLEQYKRFWEARGRPCPGRPRMGIWVVEGETLICAVGMFLTDGPYALLDGYASNPDVALRPRHRGAEFLLESALKLSAMVDKTILFAPARRIRGIARIAARLGFGAGAERPLFGGLRE